MRGGMGRGMRFSDEKTKRKISNRELLKQFVKYYRPHLKLFAADMTTAIIIAGVTLVIPWIIRNVLNDYLPQKNLPMLLEAVGAVFLLTVVLGIAHYVNVRWGHILGARMENDMRRDLFSHLQKLSFSYFDRTKTGHIMSRLSNDLTSLAEAAHHAPEDLFISLITIVGAFIFMFYFNVYLAVAALIPLPVILLWGIVFQRKMRDNFREVRSKVAEINSQVENSIQGIREVKSFVNEERQINKFHQVNNSFLSARERVFGTLALFFSGMMFLIQCYSMVIIGAGAVLMYYGHATMVDILTFFLYNRFIMQPIFKLTNFVEIFQQGAAAFERFVEIMEVEEDIKDHENAFEPEKINGEITFDNVSFKYDEQVEAEKQNRELVLNNVSLSIKPGTTVALVGASGAGKSTLAALIPRFYEAKNGSVKIDGIDVKNLKQHFLRANIGVVQQNAFLFDSTIRENILLGEPDASDEQLVAAAKNANIFDFIASLPDGLDAKVGEHGVKLSGGQKQRIAIARVFLKNPPILIFDEATSSLDNESEKLIHESMEKLTENRTTLIIAHRLSTVKNADNIFVMQDGKVVESGTHDQLMEKKAYYHKLQNATIL
ncbi:MAG: ABC transporter ATP-binding protein [Victivallaceae bacterium]